MCFLKKKRSVRSCCNRKSEERRGKKELPKVSAWKLKNVSPPSNHSVGGRTPGSPKEVEKKGVLSSCIGKRKGEGKRRGDLFAPRRLLPHRVKGVEGHWPVHKEKKRE